MRSFLALATAITAVLAARGTLRAQDTPACRLLCRVSVERLVALGDAGGGTVSWNQTVTRHSGGYHVISQADPAQVLVFSTAGAFEKALGVRGEGPAEFKALNNAAVGPDGKLWVLDQGNQALKVVGHRDTVEQSFPARFLTSRGGLLMLPDSSFILNSLIPVAHLVGLWTHRWHPIRGHIWSAEDDDSLTRGFVKQRVYAVEGDALWVARRWDRYRLERRSLATGELLEAFEPDRSWFADFAQQPAGDRNSSDDFSLVRPKATVTAVRVINGLLWVLGYTGARGWERANADGYTNLGVLLDNVIEVFDPRTGRLLVSTRIDLPNAVAFSFLDDEAIVAHETNPLVDKSVIYRVRLQGRIPR